MSVLLALPAPAQMLASLFAGLWAVAALSAVVRAAVGR